MRFTELLETATHHPGDRTLEVPEDWRQGRAVFGGLQAALCLSAMRDLAPPPLPLRTLQTTFLAPPSGTAVRAQARVLRRGKSATHVQALLVDPARADASEGDEGVLAIAIGVFGEGRSSQVRVTPEQPQVAATGSTRFRFLPGVTPTFTQHFDATWLTGDLPFSGSSATSACLEVGMPEEPEGSEALVVALCDFVPPLALSMLSSPAPGSSLTWMLEFLTDSFDAHPMQGFRVDAELVAAADGYTSQSCFVWGPGGEPVALSRQAMVVFG